MKRLLCFIGIHKWLKPHSVEPIVCDFAGSLFAFGHQYGTQKCERCGKDRRCYRTGVESYVGSVYSMEWRKADE